MISLNKLYYHLFLYARFCMFIIGSAHTEKSFRNLIKSNWNQIVFTIFWFIWHQIDIRLAQNQSGNDEYNLISVCFSKTIHYTGIHYAAVCIIQLYLRGRASCRRCRQLALPRVKYSCIVVDNWPSPV